MLKSSSCWLTSTKFHHWGHTNEGLVNDENIESGKINSSPKAASKKVVKTEEIDEENDTKGQEISKGNSQNLRENWVSKQSFFVLILTTAWNFFFGINFFCFSREKAETFRFSLQLNFVKPYKVTTESDNQ